MDEKQLGPPDLGVAGLKVWIHGRQFPQLEDYWDGNWLQVTAICADQGAKVKVSGSILHLGEIAAFEKACEQLHATLSGSASLDGIEPEIYVELVARDQGRIQAVVRITPDPLRQDHVFRFAIDQSYLPAIVRDCQSVLGKFPVRDARP